MSPAVPLLVLALLGSGAAAPPPRLSAGEAVRLALARNPELLTAGEAALTSEYAAAGVRATYLPRIVPNLSQSGGDGPRSSSYGLTIEERTPFGPVLSLSGNVYRQSDLAPTSDTTATYRATLSQPLLRGADPAVSREPLRVASRAAESQRRTFELARQRTVVFVYQSLLSVIESEETLRVAEDAETRAERLLAFSEARFAAGSVSRLDVLRARQLRSQASLSKSSSANALADARDALRRTLGLGPDADFCLDGSPQVPVALPPLAEALEEVRERRLEAVEARSLVEDAKASLRVSRSALLPSLDGLLVYDRVGTGDGFSSASRNAEGSLGFAFTSRYDVNVGPNLAQTRIAEVQLETRRRNALVLEEDLAREVSRAYRRLATAETNLEIAELSLADAELQREVAQLRFEKGLSSNFDVVDADTSLNDARLLAFRARREIVLATLDALFASGRLLPQNFTELP
ncbi:MAG: TolC family protein [Acidobacteria bacterium]|nr:TolC family protein [Acidobacteriota bacterium]